MTNKLTPEEEELLQLKENLIKLVRHHKKTCDGESCTISLFLVRKVAEKAGIKFTDNELMSFI